MKYSELADLYEELESTGKSLEKTRLISGFLLKTGSEDLKNVILLLEGRVFPKHAEKEIGVANNLVVKLLKNVSGVSEKEIKQSWRRTGDLGLTAEETLKKKKQATLKTKHVTVSEVIKSIRACADIAGSNAVNRKINSLSEILSSATPKESKYFIRTILNMLRVGVAFGILRDAVSQAFSADKELIQEKYDLTNDLGEIAFTIRENGVKALERTGMKIGFPVRVMLFHKAENFEDGFKAVGKPAAIEFKYDGVRMQIHKNKDEVTIFTRRLDNITKQFPDVVKAVLKNVKSRTCILDAEGIAYNPKTKNYQPFQKLSRRIKRKYEVNEIIRKIPVVVYVFDVINHEGENITGKSFKERRKIIEQIVKPEKLVIECAGQIITTSTTEAEEFYDKALLLGEEGVMMKNLESPYVPGRKVGTGVKVKPVMETLDLVITGAVWGEGKRGKWLSSFVLSCKKDEGYLEVGKMGSGFTEEQFAELTRELKKKIVREAGRTVFVKPDVIVEVAYEEIQKSPTYNSGFALRFPRLVRIRDDKEDADSLEKVVRIYDSQMKS